MDFLAVGFKNDPEREAQNLAAKGVFPKLLFDQHELQRVRYLWSDDFRQVSLRLSFSFVSDEDARLLERTI